MGKFDTPIRVAEGQIEHLKQQISHLRAVLPTNEKKRVTPFIRLQNSEPLACSYLIFVR